MVYLIIASIIWSFTFGLVKYNLANLDANFIAFLRSLFALPIPLFFLKTSNLNKRHILTFIALGAIQYGAMYLSWTKSFFYINAHLVGLFTAMTPLYITLINALYQKHLSWLNVLTSTASFLAISIIYYNDFNTVPGLLKGFILVQIADISFAFGQLTYKDFKSKLPGLQDQEVFALMIFGAIIVTSIATTSSNGWNFLAQISIKQFSIILYLGLVSTGLCLFLWNKGACIVNTGTLAIMNNLKIPLGVLVSIFIFQEKADLIKIIASLMIILVCVFVHEKAPKS
ncbi:EamA-like transporter family [Candidatus Phycorickettsia trachydisci]|uniref:S-adenosylmethionine uptake transporter n=1 Tax=Candidatus Phycorickettsia trachydisci TaxID=2115978 RepID=A0A2P1P877_9RICK|nr:EamA family transporter [Candidatus Phycorickettsia trachydisci]AVP87479.1 EamA-like transporter family [Candidatus Phycorickettsia trachydisci]